MPGLIERKQTKESESLIGDLHELERVLSARPNECSWQSW